MNYLEWEAIVPEEIQADSLWKVEAYRLAHFTAELAWHDATKLVHDKRTISLADQLFRALHSLHLPKMKNSELRKF